MDAPMSLEVRVREIEICKSCRNELDADKMDFAVGKGLWDVTRGNIGFGTKRPEDRAKVGAT